MAVVPFVPAVVILAAGASARMGRPKMVLPWDGTTVLGQHWRVWSGCGIAQIAVVYDPANDPVRGELDRLGMGLRIPNAEPQRGMFSSVQCAARWPGWSDSMTHLAIALGDQPHLPAALLMELLRFQEAHPEFICQPEFGGVPRHPVVIPRDVLAALAETAAETLRDFLSTRAESRKTLHANAAGLERDIDFPYDYEALRPDGR